MLGKASEIKTLRVFETQYKQIDEVVNETLVWLGEQIVIDIKYASTLIGQRYWGTALIIYKEAKQ